MLAVPPRFTSKRRDLFSGTSAEKPQLGHLVVIRRGAPGVQSFHNMISAVRRQTEHTLEPRDSALSASSIQVMAVTGQRPHRKSKSVLRNLCKLPSPPFRSGTGKWISRSQFSRAEIAAS